MLPLVLPIVFSLASAGASGALIGDTQACLIIDPLATTETITNMEAAADRMLRVIQPQGGRALLAFLNAMSSAYAQRLVGHRASDCQDIEKTTKAIANDRN